MKEIEKELEKFQKFKSNYAFKQQEIEEIDGNNIVKENLCQMRKEKKQAIVKNGLMLVINIKVYRDILHTMGEETKEENVFTRYEFELELNCLKDFLKLEKF